MSTPTPDGQRCINCHAAARRGYITHLQTCPEWKGRAEHVGAATAAAAGRYQLLVGKLTPAKRRGRYECPSCGDQRHGGLSVDPGPAGPLFYCHGCCGGLKGPELRAVQTEILEAVGLSWTDVHHQEEAPRAPGAADTREGEDKPEKKSAATILVDLAEQLYEFGTSTDGETFGVPRAGPKVVVLLRGGHTSLRKQLAREYRRRYGKVAPAQALTDALTTLDGFAEDTEPRRLYQRVARCDGATWLDLGDLSGQAARVTGDGWTVVDRPPVLFRRTSLTGALPTPVRGGELGELWTWLNASTEDRPLILAALVAALDPDVPHVVLMLLGEQGTGKSTAAKVLSLLLDPSTVPLRKAPKDAEQWVTAAQGSWMVALDNLSGMPDWLSDSLCRASTGDGDVRRKLYTDGELATFAFRRCVILTGIDLGALNGDLADRAVTAELDMISPSDRRNERTMWPAWEAAHPRLLGAVLDLAGGVEAVVHSVELASSPRMADFAETLAAVDRVLGTAGLRRYVGAEERIAAEALTGDTFMVALTGWLKGTPWEGTAGTLHHLLTPERPPKGWPATARAVTTRLHRQAPVMRKAGWAVASRPGHGGILRWSLAPPPEIKAGIDPTNPTIPPSDGDLGWDGGVGGVDPGEFLETTDCAVPGCGNERRNGCRTCFEHMSQEMAG
jgi:hypothetical protein